MSRSLHTLVVLGTLGALLAGCSGGGSTPAASGSVSATTSTQTLSVVANTPATITAPSAGGYTPAISLPGLSTAITAPVTSSSTVPSGVTTFSLAGPVTQSVVGLQGKPSNGTTLLYVGVTPNVSTSVTAGTTFGLQLTLPSAASSSLSYYLAFFDGKTWYTNVVTAAGTASGSSVKWTSLPISINYTFNAGTTYAFALYSVPSTGSGTTAGTTPTPTPTATATATATPSATATPVGTVLTKAVPTAAPVPKSVTVSTTLPKPTATATGTPLSTADKKTQGAVSATLSAMKSKTSSAKGAKKTSKITQFFRRMVAGAFRKKLDESATCVDGLVEETTTNTDGSTQVEDVTYADQACATTVVSDATFNYQQPDGNGTVTALGGTINYAADGVTLQNYDVTDMTIYNSLATDGSYNAVSSVTHYPDTSATVALGADYLVSNITAAGAETDSTLSLTYDLTDGYEIGSLYTATSTEGTPDSSGNTQTTIAGSSQLYNDPNFALSVDSFPLAAEVTTFTVDGGTSVSNTTSSQTSTTDVNGDITADSQTTTDSTNDVQIQFSSTTGGYTGTITQISTGTVLGTMTTNEVGTGTVTYSDGTTGTLTEFAVGS